MLQFLPGPIHGVISLLLVSIYTGIIGIFFLTFALLKIIIPFKPWRRLCYKASMLFGKIWITITMFIVDFTKNIEWDFQYNGKLSMEDWYLIISNHQSWLDIIVLEKLLFQKIPISKYFIKEQLMWIPGLGIGFWLLNFPVMKRYSREKIAKNPLLQGKDIENTRKACEHYKSEPVSITNFPEGTRFSSEKQTNQNNSFKNLLNPKAGGMSFVLNSMEGILNKIADVSINYPQENSSFWDFLCGKINKIKATVTIKPIVKDLYGDYEDDSVYRENFQNWLNALWKEKDKEISRNNF